MEYNRTKILCHWGKMPWLQDKWKAVDVSCLSQWKIAVQGEEAFQDDLHIS